MKSYQTIFSLTDFPTYYVNSIIVALSTTLLTILVVTPMAYALVRSHLPGMLVDCAGHAVCLYVSGPAAGDSDLHLPGEGGALTTRCSSLVLTYSSFTLPLGGMAHVGLLQKLSL